MKAFETLPVFRLYAHVIRRNLSLLIMYFAIFTALAVAFSRMAGTEIVKQFAAQSVPVAVTDLDESTLSKGIADYLAKKNEVTFSDGNKRELTRDFYYQDVMYYVSIPAGFSDAFAEATEKETALPALDVVKHGQDASGYYIDAELSQFLLRVKMYLTAGFTMEEAVDRALALPDASDNISFLQKDGGDAKPAYAYTLQYLPYLYLAALIYCVSYVFKTFRDRNISLRMSASPVSASGRLLQGMLAFALLIAAFFCVSLLVPLPAAGSAFYTCKNLLLHILNALCMLGFAASVAFLIGNVATGDQVIAALANVVSLGTSFLCGIFVPLEFLGENVLRFSRFIPVYWYERVNDVLAVKEAFSAEDVSLIRQGMLIQVAATAAVTVITLYLVKNREE